MGELIERMARALCKADGRDPDRLEEGNTPYGTDEFVDGELKGGPAFLFWRAYVPDARAALRSALEPTEAQYEALSATGKPWREMNSAFVWKTYIEAELKEP